MIRKVVKKTLFPLLLKILPKSLIDQVKFEFLLFPVKIRSNSVKRRFKGKKNLLVNLGAGYCGHEGWINVDGFANPGVNCLYDCRSSLPFEENSVSAIFSEHFIEHVHPKDELPNLLTDCYRVLQKNGIIRIIVPDAGRYLKAYNGSDWSDLSKIRSLDINRKDPFLNLSYDTPMELINEVFRQGMEHKFAYDFQTLELYLRKAGFASVILSEFGKSLKLGLAIDLPERACESLYVEAIKS